MGVHYNNATFFRFGRPTAYWDFANRKSSIDIINKIPLTISRNSIGTYFDSSGVMQTASANIPRFDHNPITLERLGLMTEVSSTNLLLNSASLSTQSVTVTATVYTLTFYGTGTVSLSGVYSGSLVGTNAYPVRSTLTFTVATGGTLTLTVTGTVQYAQLEAQSFQTSYIPTTTTSITRLAESAVTPTSSTWYDASAGTLFVEMKNSGYINFAHAGTGLSLDNNQFQRNMISLNVQRDSPYYREGALIIFPDSGSYVSQSTSGSSNNITDGNVFYKFAGSFATNYTAFAYNGLGASSTPTIAMPIISRLLISTNSNYAYDQFNGWIKSISYYPRTFTSTELATLTTY
jgi:hypothetical protein